MVKLFQPFHLVTISPWPLVISFSIFNIFTSIIFWFNFGVFHWVVLNLLMVVFILFQWWRDVIRESLFQGFHTLKVLFGLKVSMVLFIISEVFFFISIFWAYFHMFLSLSIEIGSGWPPLNIIPFNPYSIPLLNTVILLSSGVSISWCHYSILKMNKLDSVISLLITIVLGFIFSFFQVEEYLSASFTWSDSVYGSCFFMVLRLTWEVSDYKMLHQRCDRFFDQSSPDQKLMISPTWASISKSHKSIASLVRDSVCGGSTISRYFNNYLRSRSYMCSTALYLNK